MLNKVKKIILNEWVLLIGILLIGFLVRLYKYNLPLADWHSWRQADTASVTRIYVDEGINLLYPKYYDVSSIQSGYSNLKGYRFVEFPLYNLIHAVAVNTYKGISLEAWGRVLSAFYSLVSAIFVFLLGKRFIGKWGGLISAFYFLFIPYNIFYSRVILPEPLATTLALASLWLFVVYQNKQKLSYLYLSAIILCLSLLVKPFTIFFIIPMIYLTIKKHGFKELYSSKEIIKYLIYILIMILPFFIWRVWINDYPAGIPFYKWAFNGDMIRFRPAFWRWIFGERLGRLILGTWGVLPFGIGIISVIKKNYFIHSFLLAMFVYVSLVATANVRHDYYQIFLVPAIALTLGQGSVFLINKFNKSWIARGVLGFCVVMMLGIGAYQVKAYYQINHPEIIEAGQAIDQLVPKDAKVIAPYNGDTAFLYQTKRYGWPAIDDSIEKLIRRGASYFVSVNQDKDTLFMTTHYKTIEEADKYVIVDLTKPL